MARKKQQIVDGAGRRYAVTGYRPFVNEVIVEPEGPAPGASAADRRPVSGQRRTPAAPSAARSPSSGQPPAQSRRAPAQRSTPRAALARRPNRDQALRAAIADGRLVDADLPAWRSGWDRDPTGTARALANIPEGSATAAEAQRSGQQRTGAAGQQRSGRASGPSPGGPGASGGALERAGQRPTFHGHETRANSAGELCVLAPSGWLTVAAAQAAGVGEAEMRSAQALRSQGGSRMARLYREGPR